MLLVVGRCHRTEILISSSHRWKINTRFWIWKECQTWQSAFGFFSTPSHSSVASKPKNARRFPCSLQAKAPPTWLAIPRDFFAGDNLIPSILVRVHLPPRSKQIVFTPLTCDSPACASLYPAPLPKGSLDLQRNWENVLQKICPGKMTD